MTGTERIVVGATGRPRLTPGRPDPSFEPRHYIWQPWRGRNWPATASEEAEFAVDLADRARTAPRRRVADRADYTTVLNALRCGMSCDDLFDRCPGVDPACLYDAYETLDGLRRRAADAYRRIADDATLDTLALYALPAAVLVPVPVRAMSPSAAASSPDALRARIGKVAAQVAETQASAADIEARLARLNAPSAVGVELGRQLYDLHDPGLWSDPYYLPCRVGDLVPVRVADLLGERRA